MVRQAESLMIKCEAADRYEAVYPPRCDGGKACEACVAKWQAAQQARIDRANGRLNYGMVPR